ncbi:hypothetical protein J6590_107326, partial [Homalodisca vitripennis]
MDLLEMEHLSSFEEALFPGDDGDDQDKTYEPESSESDSSDEEQLANVEPAEIERPRKRQCKEGMWKRKRASTLRNSGLEYKDRKGRLHAAKKTTDFQKPSTDTCNTCDLLKNQIDHVKTPGQKSELLTKKELHLRKAESARKAKEEAVTL